MTSIDPTAQTRWIPAQKVELLAESGVLYRPDPVLGLSARQRLRAGPAAYSLCGVTHTLATATTLDFIAKFLVEPVMPWDALVCTSTVALEVVTAVLDREAELQRWRGAPVPAAAPLLLPVIPLGVHCDDFVFTDRDRAAARDELSLGPNAVAVLVPGRLSIAGKAHPYPTIRALQRVAAETGAEIVAIFAGQAFSAAASDMYRSATVEFSPDVRTIFVDGADPDAYRRSWAAADIFVSLADSIQETFGITPLEAMAAGLPALVSDWNGYKDTVRDGIDGFRIPTSALSPGSGHDIARDYEVGVNNYDEYLFRCCTAVAVDMGQLVARLRDLVLDRPLRRRLGFAGQERARSTFDWSVVFRSYQALWDEQTSIRQRAEQTPDTRAWLARSPGSGTDHAGPFDLFASYPTRHMTPDVLVSPAPGVTLEAYEKLIGHHLMSFSAVAPQIVGRVLAAIGSGPMTAEHLARTTGLSVEQVMVVAVRLAKIDVVALDAE